MKSKQIATFGGGCFWCIEALIQRLIGVSSVITGYAGGKSQDPDYRAVSTGMTGYAEVVSVIFDSNLISYSDLISIFMTSHDPTTLNCQGADAGSQYRSIILYHDRHQRAMAENALDILQTKYEKAIVTEVAPFTKFYQAEDYHQNYYNSNVNGGYCLAVIRPKIKKMKKYYADRMVT